MRLVVRYLLVEFSLAWALVLAGFVRAGVQIWPFFANRLMSGLRCRRWRAGLALLLAFPVVVGWPLLFMTAVQEPEQQQGWLLAVAIPWWIVLGGIVSVHLVARAGHRVEGPRTQCRCGTCVARATRALTS